ncbi:MAG: iron-containing alcohol dehydrogenase [Thermoguttaceae bacterium]
MQNFQYRNPVEIVFGRGSIAKLSDLVPRDKKVMMTYGGGSIKKNGVYDQVTKALASHRVVEFGGIEPNPRYETLMKAVEIVKRDKIDFLLSVGGGSTLDGTKFIAAAAKFGAGDPWDILEKNAVVESAVPLGAVITLPATGSEMNCFSVVSRNSTAQKLAFAAPPVFPQFSILDPETTFTLPAHQVSNGIVDAFVHVCEQYMTFDVNAPLQDLQAEAILHVLIGEGPKTLKNLTDYDSRANLVWAATNALNGWIGCGVPQDWVTHNIGHEITALCGIDHAKTLALVMPAVWQQQRKVKGKKLIAYGQRVWGITSGNDDARIDAAIQKTVDFFASVGIPPYKLGDYKVTDADCAMVARRIAERGPQGEKQQIGEAELLDILRKCL